MCRFEAGQAGAGAVAGVGAEAEAANWPHTLWLITSAESLHYREWHHQWREQEGGSDIESHKKQHK